MGLTINIRGMNGSGKTTLMKDFMGDPQQTIKHFEFVYNIDKKVQGTAFKLADGGAGIAVGSYSPDLPSGGCDGIHTQDEVCDRVRYFSDKYDVVLFEGVVVSTIAQRYIDLGKELEAKGHTFAVAYLDTPIDICVHNICKRREQSKVKRKTPFNYQLLVDKQKSIAATRPKFADAGISTFALIWPMPLLDLQHLVAHRSEVMNGAS